jgi:iron complex transport system substrate-binding protein
MKLAQWDMVSVEQILLSPPDIVMTGAAGMESDGSSPGNARNFVLAKAARRIMIAEFPSRLLHCAGPTIIDTAGLLYSIRERWRREHKA